jgi:hypothetical protein
VTDLLLRSLQQSPFSWGGRSLIENSKTREAYLSALRAADKNEYRLLQQFVRS